MTPAPTTLADVIKAVNDEKTVEQSAIALLNGLTAKINILLAASGSSVDSSALRVIVDSINTNKTALVAAVIANTPVPILPPPPPIPPPPI